MMTLAYPSEWIVKAEQALAQLAEKPWALFFLLLTISSIAQPYAGVTHDTRLYSVQVLNQVEDGAYADDLFFRYGSQDQYSLFSRLAAPLVRMLGLPVAFFLIYLFSKSILIFGMMRVALALVPNRAAVTLALIYVLAVPLHYGGQHILNLEENFVTPRTLACGLVLIGVGLLLRGRPVGSLMLMLLAAGVHPLMACGGILIWSGFHLWQYCGTKAFVASLVAAVALAATVLAVEPVGIRFFGRMDDAWRITIMHASSFNFPSEWSWRDWSYLAIQLAILSVVIWKYRSLDGTKARFLAVLMLVTLAGAVGAVLAEELPYALLLQGQPYRALWMLAFLHIPFVFWLCMEWSKQAALHGQLAGCVLLTYLCSVNAITEEYVLPFSLFPVVAVALRGLARQPRCQGWLVRSIQISVVVGALLWVGYKLVLLASGTDELYRKYPDYFDILEVFLLNLGPILLIGIVCALLVLFTPQRWSRPRWVALTATACLAWQTSCFAFPRTDYYRDHCTRYRADLKAMHDLLHKGDRQGQPLPTVYCNLGCLDYIWLDMHAKSYFNWWQAGNFMFRREMAVEGQRRACIVAPFELERYRKIEDQLTDGAKDAIARFFKTDFDRGPVGKEDIARLCREPDLDYLVLEQPYEGLYTARAGRLYLYDCRQVRVALNLPAPRRSTAVASNQ